MPREDEVRVNTNIWHDLCGALANVREAVLLVLDGVTGEASKEQKKILKIAKLNIDKLDKLIQEAREKFDPKT